MSHSPDSEHHDHHDHSHTESMYDVDPTHHHPPQPDVEDSPLTHHQVMQIAVTELLIDKGLFDAAQMRRQIEKMDSLSPARGAKLIARAWVDAAFKQRLLTDSRAAGKELGIDLGPVPILVMENTQDVHNLVVCTLCSCYPRMLLGFPPDWYKSRSYRSRAVREPRKLLAEFGTNLPEGSQVRVHDSTADMRYLVLPARPAGTETLSEEALASLVTRDCMIGVAVADSQ
ncbi:MAG: nitrile hydratase subunit alpha [Burkholderiaceae bacterium]